MLLRNTQVRQLIGTWTIEAAVTGEDVTGFKLDHDITVREAQTVMRTSSGAVFWSMLANADRSTGPGGYHVFSGETTSGVAAETVGIVHTPLNALIASGTWVYIRNVLVNGVVSEFTLTLWA